MRQENSGTRRRTAERQVIIGGLFSVWLGAGFARVQSFSAIASQNLIEEVEFRISGHEVI